MVATAVFILAAAPLPKQAYRTDMSPYDLPVMQIREGLMKRIETLVIAGAMTIDRAVELRQRFVNAVADADTLRLQLANVTDIDTTGVQLLMATKRTAQASGKSLELVEHSREILAVFALLDLINYFGDPVHVAPARPAPQQMSEHVPPQMPFADQSGCKA
jgi:anti-sigma B factor antagonist